VIGVVSAAGRFEVDNREMADHATLFDGSVVLSRQTAPRLDLKDGAWMRFGPHSMAKIAGHDIRLDGGIGELGSAGGYRLLVKTLSIQPARPESVVRVQIAGDSKVLVAAYTAPVRVFTAAGLLIATLDSGETLGFDTHAGPATTTGCLFKSKSRGRFILVASEGAPRDIEVRGPGLAKEVGNQVTVHGNVIPDATPVDCADLVMELTSLPHRIAKGCSVKAPSGCASRAQPAALSRPIATLHGHLVPYVLGGVAVTAATIGSIAATRDSESNQ
jgi:hypothetical protein